MNKIFFNQNLVGGLPKLDLTLVYTATTSGVQYYFSDAVSDPYVYRQWIHSYDHYHLYVPNYEMTEEFWVENETKSRFGKGAWTKAEGDDISGETLDYVKISFGYGRYDSSDIDVNNCTSQLIIYKNGIPVALDPDVIEKDEYQAITALFIAGQLDITFGDDNLPRLEAHLTINHGGSMKKWTCTTCGYVAEDTQPPTKCPICGMSDFVTT